MSVLVAAPPARRSVPRVDLPRLRRRAGRVLAELCHAGSELSVALVDDPEIARLNRTFRRRRGPTDVLSFSMLEGSHAERRGALLGDVVIGIETAQRQARRGGRSLDDEVARLMVHGVLHLLGHDHARAPETRAMRAEERRLWRAIAS
jgi:probable rRNA maturation factor